jgi:hypothetical protein
MYNCITLNTMYCNIDYIWYAEHIHCLYVVKVIHEFALVAVCRPHYDGLLLCLVRFGVNSNRR